MKELLIIGTVFMFAMVVGVLALVIARMNDRKNSNKWGYDATNKRWYKVK